jgi:Domain of unknown function (DUF4177)
VYEYKVLTERDKVFSGAFDLDALEETLNNYATQEWRLVNGFLAANLWKSAKAEIVLILERPAPNPTRDPSEADEAM